MTKSRSGEVAREEFVGDYPVLGIITQYQGLFIPVRTINLCFFIMVVAMGCLWCALNCWRTNNQKRIEWDSQTAKKLSVLKPWRLILKMEPLKLTDNACMLMVEVGCTNF